MNRAAVVVGLVAVLLLPFCASAGAQSRADDDGTIEGVVSTQEGTVRLPGALVSVRSATDHELAQQVSNEDGHVRISQLPPGQYHLQVSLDGFTPKDVAVAVLSGQVAEVAVDLPIAAVAERVDVVASPVVSTSGSLSATSSVRQSDAQLILPGGGVQSALRLIPQVIQLPTGASIDGGRPSQVGFQVQSVSLVDPVANLAHPTLPSSAIESVSVLPNPYESEFGRFSSGVIAVQTHRAPDKWKTDFDNLEPALRLKRFTLFQFTGVTLFQPSVATGGALVPGRVFLEQTAQYHYQTTDIPSRPEDELRTTQWFSTLTRVDVNLAPQHSLVVAGGFFPNSTTQATLGTFTPPAATADLGGHIDHAMVAERAVLHRSAFVESTLQLQHYHTDVHGQGSAAMELLPETTEGNFFNEQHREAWSYQWVETISAAHRARWGLHEAKAGFDLLHSRYDGTSLSGPVLIERSDTTLSRRLDFGGPTTQEAAATDVALFAQDRLQLASRSYVEVGGRLDRDGVADRVAGSPRVGTAILLNGAGTSVVRAGFGLFYERMPLAAAAFDQFEPATDTRFATDGATPIGPPVLYEHVTAPDLEAARSATWDVSFDHRVNRFVAFHMGLLNRQGSHQLILDPLSPVNGVTGQLLLSSTGRSSFRQAEASLHLTVGSRLDVNASYTQSSAREDLNSFLVYFDAVLNPIVGVNAYAPAPADAPHRFFVIGRASPGREWLLVGVLDWRDGLPYSIMDDGLDFVGARNDRRFPTYVRLETGFDRRLHVAHLHPWLGLRVVNALNAFLPTDVQANTGSPAYGTFYNSEYREFRIHLRFTR